MDDYITPNLIGGSAGSELIWGRLRQGISPEINAAATIIIAVSLAGVLLSNRLSKQAAVGG